MLLADRHSLLELKKVTIKTLKISKQQIIKFIIQRIIAWILAEKEAFMANKTFFGEIEKHPALLMELFLKK